MEQQHTKQGTINFSEELAREKALAASKIQLKESNVMNTFNLLQDMRHLIILDFRDEQDFNKSHIRKAERATLDTYKEMVAGYLVSLRLS